MKRLFLMLCVAAGFAACGDGSDSLRTNDTSMADTTTLPRDTMK